MLLGTIGEELRPTTVQRPAAGGSDAAAETANQMLAWLPVDEARVDPANDSVHYVAETRHSVAGGFLTFWRNTGEAEFLGNPLSEEYVLSGVTYQVFERGQLAWQQGKDPWLVPVGTLLAERYKLDQQPIAQGDLPTYSEDLFTPPPALSFEVADAGPGPAPGTSQSIVVSLSEQRMWLYEGDTAILSTYVSTGRPEFATPTGTFSIVVKKEVEDMAGLIGGEYYDVPEVPDVMYFTGVGHAIHGTYWHNNFGQVMSHGCINLPLDIADFLYDWTPMGTTVQILP